MKRQEKEEKAEEKQRVIDQENLLNEKLQLSLRLELMEEGKGQTVAGESKNEASGDVMDESGVEKQDQDTDTETGSSHDGEMTVTDYVVDRERD